MLKLGRNSKTMLTEVAFAEMGQDVKIFTFNLPAIQSCPEAWHCKRLCYATQGRYVFPNAKKVREENYSFIKEHIEKHVQRENDGGDDLYLIKLEHEFFSLIDNTFGKRLDMKENKKGQRVRNIIRLHDSGDFFHREYFRVWLNVINSYNTASKNIEIYAYTKSHRLFKNTSNYFENFFLPENFRLIQSFGGRSDFLIDERKPHAKVFSSLESLLEAGYVDGSKSEIPAIEGEVKIGLVYHGAKKPNPKTDLFIV